MKKKRIKVNVPAGTLTADSNFIKKHVYRTPPIFAYSARDLQPHPGGKSRDPRITYKKVDNRGTRQ